MIAPTSPLVPAAVLLLLLLVSLPLVVPGLLMASHLTGRVGLPRSLVLLVAIAASALLGYAVFWGYFASAWLGFVISLVVLAATLTATLHPSTRARLRATFSHADVRLPAIAMVCAAFFHLNLLLGFVPDPVPADLTWTEHVNAVEMTRGPENRIPLNLAHRLYHDLDLRDPIYPILWGGLGSASKSSDRPPLQASLVLVGYPLWNAIPPALGGVEAAYQVLGTLLQTVWVAAVWALLRGLGSDRRRSGIVLLALVSSEFFFFNSVKVWPKLLAGGLAVGCFCMLFLRERGDRPSPPQMALAAALAALAALAHSGVATSLVGFGLVLLHPRWFPGVRNVVIGAVVVAALLSPWLAYQQLYDPPGNYLLKTHLAGPGLIDDRTTLEAVADTYAALTFEDWAEKKARMLRWVLWIDRQSLPIEGLESAAWALRYHARLHLFANLGWLNAGWIAVLVGLLRRASSPPPSWRAVAGVLAVALLCVLLSLLVQVTWPIPQHLSAATVILLFAGLAAAVVKLPRPLCLFLLAAHVTVSLAMISGAQAPRQFAPFPFAAAALTWLACAVACLAPRVAVSRRLP